MTVKIRVPRFVIVWPRRKHEGEMLPVGYGVAWENWQYDQLVLVPWPFNRIAGAFRAWYLEWRRPVENDPIAVAYRQGLDAGKQLARSQMDATIQRHFAELQAAIAATPKMMVGVLPVGFGYAPDDATAQRNRRN